MPATRRLPDELLIEILTWLPAKCLIRSRCVCRAWLKLLTLDPHFQKLHLHRIINNHPNHNPSVLWVRLQKLYITSTESDNAPTLEIPCPFNISFPTQHDISGICNGLVCFANPSHPNISIWNPLANDHVTIPSPFPCGTTSTTYGFGFCQVTSEFKVLQFLYMNYSAFQSDVNVYTLGTNSWRAIGTVPYNIRLSKLHTALVHNSLHWFASMPDKVADNLVVSFNMKEETFQEVPLPNGINYDYPNHVTMGELGGLLCLFCAIAKQCIQIWLMKEHGNVDSWTKQFKIGRPEVTGEFIFLRPLGLADGGEIIIVKNAREIILYNPRTNSTRRIKRFDCKLCDAYPFIGSNVSPTLVKGVNTSPI